METLIIAVIVGASMGWFGHKLYRTATTENAGCSCGCGCNCGKDSLEDYRNDKQGHQERL